MSLTVEFSSKIISDEWLGHFDMLRDQRRNRAYQRGVQSLSSRDEYKGKCEKDEEYWIDIGCGSGLLGCLVGKYLKKKVVAFECVPKLAKIARETIRRNNLQDSVMVWLVHTSDLDSQFMERTFGQRATYVISELLDTTLLGEGLYEGMLHAYSHLLKSSIPRRVTSIPHYARVFVQVKFPFFLFSLPSRVGAGIVFLIEGI
jgi:predicted RNA methylase